MNFPCMEERLFEFLEQHISLTDEDRHLFMSLDLFREVKKGSSLLNEGEYAKESYFVIQGCLRSFYLREGEEKTTGFFQEEEGLVPESLITGKPSRYYISAEEDTVLLVSTPGMEAEVFQKVPKFESLCRVLGEKELARQQTAHDDFVTASPEERYLMLLKQKPQLLQRVPQYQIASFIGVKPESLSRIRRRQKETLE